MVRLLYSLCGLSFLQSALFSLIIIGIPIALRVIYASRFVRGPFHLGRFSFPVAIASVLWICCITIAFILPEENPVNSQTLNYAVVAVGIVVTYSLGFWMLSARKWFTGPVKQIAGESLPQNHRMRSFEAHS